MLRYRGTGNIGSDLARKDSHYLARHEESLIMSLINASSGTVLSWVFINKQYHYIWYTGKGKRESDTYM